MLYGKWCRDSSFVSIFYFSKRLNKCQFDILRFLAENGPRTPYQLWKGPKIGEQKRDEKKKLGYSYPHILGSLDALESEEKMIEEKQVIRGGRVRRRFSINFRGLITYFLAWNKITKKVKKEISKAIAKNGGLLPFSEQWKDIVKIAGEDQAFDSLIKCASTNVFFLRFERDDLNLNFEAFARGIRMGLIISDEGDEIREYRNDKFDRFLAQHDELKNAYIAYLAREDILAFLREKLKINSLKSWWSEKELARFEKRNVNTNPIFPNQRLKEFFPQSATIQHLFTGMLMDSLLWKKSEVKKRPPFPIEKGGFRVSLLQ